MGVFVRVTVDFSGFFFWPENEEQWFLLFSLSSIFWLDFLCWEERDFIYIRRFQAESPCVYLAKKKGMNALEWDHTFFHGTYWGKVIYKFILFFISFYHYGLINLVQGLSNMPCDNLISLILNSFELKIVWKSHLTMMLI